MSDAIGLVSKDHQVDDTKSFEPNQSSNSMSKSLDQHDFNNTSMSFQNVKPRTPGTPKREEVETADNTIQWITKAVRDHHIDREWLKEFKYFGYENESRLEQYLK